MAKETKVTAVDDLTGLKKLPTHAHRQLALVADSGLVYRYDGTSDDTANDGDVVRPNNVAAEKIGRWKLNDYKVAAFSGVKSFQPIGADLELGAAAGSTDDDPKFLGAAMGNVLGADLTKEGAYLAGLIGAFSVTGAKATKWPAGGVVGIISDGVTEADGAVVAHLDGDSEQTKANAAFKAMMRNSTAGSGFNFGLDLYDPGFGAFPALAILKASIRMENEICILQKAGVPDATTGDDIAGPGSLCIDRTNKKLYINGGTKADPDWKLVTSA